MTGQEQLGQLFMVGFEGTEPSGEFLSWLKQLRPGGVIVFSRNLESPLQIAQLTNLLQDSSPALPLFIAIDQEGGRVSRLPPGFTVFPPAATVTACRSIDLAYEAAAVTAKELRAVGINMNMAPVLDVNTNPSNPIIGDRAFGETPEQVCEFGQATIDGLQDHGVVACGKHFPGHGDTTADSHLELPVVNVSRDRLYEVEIPPFRHAIQHGLPTIMSAHVRYPALDDSAPATLSHAILSDLLRGELGFQGVILTDDLEMNAILDHGSVGEAAVQSLHAGADMLLICRRQDLQMEALEAVQKAFKDSKISMNRIESSLARIQSLRERFLTSSRPIELEHVPQLVGISAHRQVLETIQSVTKNF